MTKNEHQLTRLIRQRTAEELAWLVRLCEYMRRHRLTVEQEAELIWLQQQLAQWVRIAQDCVGRGIVSRGGVRD